MDDSSVSSSKVGAWTPGPWDFESADLYADRFAKVNWALRIYSTDPGPERDFTIAFVSEIDPKLRETHAKLIAAAPELAEALRDCVDWIKFYGAVNDPNHADMLPKAEAVLAKL